MNKEQVFRKIVKLQTDADAWLDTVPREIKAAFFDNDYVNNLRMMIHLLMDQYFAEHVTSIEWFLYEWKPGSEIGYGDYGDTALTPIHNIDDMINWMKVNEGFE
jgi:hypothetical protein